MHQILNVSISLTIHKENDNKKWKRQNEKKRKKNCSHTSYVLQFVLIYNHIKDTNPYKVGEKNVYQCGGQQLVVGLLADANQEEMMGRNCVPSCGVCQLDRPR